MEISRPIKHIRLWSMLFFPLIILYEELLLRALSANAAPWDHHLLLIAVFSLTTGLFVWFLMGLLPTRRGRLTAAVIFSLLLAVIFSVEYTVNAFFQTYFEFSLMFSMAGDVAGQFAAESSEAIKSALPFILLSFIPALLLVMFHRIVIPAKRISRDEAFWSVMVSVVLESITVVPMVLGSTFPHDRDAYLGSYTANSAIPRFGVVKSLQLEAAYSLLGLPEEFLIAGQAPAEEALPTPVVYPYNAMDIDFEALKAETSDKTLLSLHGYFSTKTPTQQNEYTGMFEGKNLIFIVAEAFSPYVIDPELTPTLYKLSTEGFVFTDYYQPDWTQSTFGGEFAAVSGLVPTWINNTYSFSVSADNAMPFALGNQFRKLGYTTAAFHNHYGGYYGRIYTHPNLGYDYRAIDYGLELETQGWPNSDLEMMEATIGDYIDSYVSQGQPFHAYYMTVSGHTAYSFSGNRMSRKHKEEVAHLDHSETIQAYLACQLEVEYALSYLLEQLEAAGIADDTVIALTADHYPYALTENFGTDYYRELESSPTTTQDTARYKNSFLLWSGCMEEPVTITIPCSSIDIIPTLSNLFGLEYDSRLLSGRDILATNYDAADPNSPQPFVVFTDKGSGISWISIAGEYNAFKNTFTPNPGFESYAENEAYLEAMHKKASSMFKYARNLVKTDYYSVVFNE